MTVGDHAFSQMQGDLDQQRLLGERPFNDPLADIMVKEIQHQERSVHIVIRIFLHLALISVITLVSAHCIIYCF